MRQRPLLLKQSAVAASIERRCPTKQLIVSPRRHTFALDHRYGVRRFQVVDERLRGCGFLRARTERGREYDILLQVSGERANHVQARHRQDVHQEQREFSLPLGDHSDDLCRRRLRFHLGFHRLGDAEALEYLRD